MNTEAIKQVNEEILKLLEGCKKQERNICGVTKRFNVINKTWRKCYCDGCKSKLKTWLTAIKGELEFLKQNNELMVLHQSSFEAYGHCIEEGLQDEYAEDILKLADLRSLLRERISNLKETIKAIEEVLK